MSRLIRYWGYLALALAIAGWFAHLFTAAIILVLSIAAVGYFLLQAPVWCGAITRDGRMCRHNSTGLLLGCHLREHKWQKIKMTFAPKGWREINRGLWASPREGVTTMSGVAAVISALAAAVVALK
jgi:hypothetical protein